MPSSGSGSGGDSGGIIKSNYYYDYHNWNSQLFSHILTSISTTSTTYNDGDSISSSDDDMMIALRMIHVITSTWFGKWSDDNVVLCSEV